MLLNMLMYGAQPEELKIVRKVYLDLYEAKEKERQDRYKVLESLQRLVHRYAEKYRR